VNFADNFYLPLNQILLTLGYPSKLFGAHLGARIGGLSRRDSWAVGVSMNTHDVLE